MLDTALLKAFMNGFFGYGNPEASLWFIAMEEGGGKSESEIAARMVAWDRRERREIEDLRAFCAAASHNNLDKYSGPSLHPVNTWHGMVAYQLGLEGIYDPTEIQHYEQFDWLIRGGNNCLLNLFPLPCPTTKHWNYQSWSDISFLKSRESYKCELRETRIAALRKLITLHRPKTVVFCSVDSEYKKYWELVEEGINDVIFETIAHPRSAQNRKAPKERSTTYQPFFNTLFDELRASPHYQQYCLQVVVDKMPDHYKQLHSFKGDKFHVSFVKDASQRPDDGVFTPSAQGHPLRLEYTLQNGSKRLFDMIHAKRSFIAPNLERQLTWHRLDDDVNRSIIAQYYTGGDNESRRREWVFANAKPFVDELSQFAQLS